MVETAFTKMLGLAVPIQLAPMGGVATPRLAVAVTNAGGLGMLPAALMPPELLESTLAEMAEQTEGRPFGVNFLMPFLDPDCVEVAACGARVVEFFYADPDAALVERVHAAGALAAWQVGSLTEALAAERAGCDFVVAQGTEAGGHVRGGISLMPFLSEVLGQVRVPVVAAGGVATARDLAAVLAAGAAGARIGTRFAASTESGAHPKYVEALLAATAEDTCLTEAFSVMWPNAPHRVLRSCIEAAERATEAVVGETPHGGQTLPIERFSVVCPSLETTGRIEAMALYAGESVTNVSSVRSVEEIVAELAGRPAGGRR